MFSKHPSSHLVRNMAKRSLEWSILRILIVTTLVAMVVGLSITAYVSYESIGRLRTSQKLHHLETLSRVFQGKLEIYDIHNTQKLLERELSPNGFLRLTLVDRYGMRHGDAGSETPGEADHILDIRSDEGIYLGELSAWDGSDRFFNSIFRSFLTSRLTEFLIIFILFATLIRKRLTREVITPLNALRDYVSSGKLGRIHGSEKDSFRCFIELSEIADVYDQSVTQFQTVEHEKHRALADEIRAKNARLFQALILERVLENSKMGVVYQADETKVELSTTGIALPSELFNILQAMRQSTRSNLKCAFEKAGFNVSKDHISSGPVPNSRADSNKILCTSPNGQSFLIHAISFFPCGWACLCVDVTDQVEEEKRSVQREKLESLGVLSSGIAHDINNVLAIISASLELKQSTHEDHDLDQALLAVDRGKGVVKQLLTFAHAKEPKMEQVSTAQLFEELEKMIPATMGPSIPAVMKFLTSRKILCDLDLLQMTIINLCINARDAILSQKPGGKIQIICSDLSPRDAVSYGYDTNAKLIAIDIIDSGPGVPAEVRERIFEPFYTTKPIGKGTGLGLSSSYTNLRKVGGHLSCEHNPGGGAKFRIILPSTNVIEITSTEKKPNLVVTQNKRILIVDDEKGLCDIMAQFLERSGFTVTKAYSVSEACSYVKDDANYSFDIIVSDLHLSDGKGTDIYDYIRRQGRLKMLIISGNVTAEDLSKLVKDPDAEILEKPFGLKDLATNVEQLLQGSHHRNTDALITLDNYHDSESEVS